MAHKYTDAVANAFSSGQAWKFSSFLLGMVVLILSIALVKKSFQETIVLVPHELASAKRYVTLDSTDRMMNPDYLQYLAIADLNLLINWTPSTVRMQTLRFLNRMTPELYSSQNIQLVQQAEAASKNSTSQAFYPEGKVKINQKGLVAVDGFVIRWTGDKEILRYKDTYEIQYKEAGGYLLVDNVTTASNKKYAETLAKSAEANKK